MSSSSKTISGFSSFGSKSLSVLNADEYFLLATKSVAFERISFSVCPDTGIQKTAYSIKIVVNFLIIIP